MSMKSNLLLRIEQGLSGAASEIQDSKNPEEPTISIASVCYINKDGTLGPKIKPIKPSKNYIKVQPEKISV